MASKEFKTKIEEDDGFRIALLDMVSDGRINVTDGKFELTKKVTLNKDPKDIKSISWFQNGKLRKVMYE
tara:strand:- start:139 stop:345 length:207 start_codon:yes stop_codon:yes gene_type:complete